MSTTTKNLGAVTAYKYAVNGGFQGTEAEFEALLANLPAVDDTAGEGDTDKVWSADKTFSELSDAKSTLVQDVLVNDTSVVTDGVANIPVAGLNTFGAVKIFGALGVDINNGNLVISQANESQAKAGTDAYKPIVSSNQHFSAFYGLAKAAGDSTQSASANAVGTYTESAKSAIAEMLGGAETVSGTTPTITAKAGVRYICGEVTTLAVTAPATGIIDVIFTSGSTPTVLTVTPPTGVTLKWANGFDPTALEADTTYEINIADGCLGVAAEWT